jgi:hypothetical protein
MEAGSSAEVVLEVADPVDLADRYAVGALVRAVLPRPQHRGLKAVTIIERASSTTPTTDHRVGGMPRLG